MDRPHPNHRYNPNPGSKGNLIKGVCKYHPANVILERHMNILSCFPKSAQISRFLGMSSDMANWRNLMKNVNESFDNATVGDFLLADKLKKIACGTLYFAMASDRPALLQIRDDEAGGFLSGVVCYFIIIPFIAFVT